MKAERLRDLRKIRDMLDDLEQKCEHDADPVVIMADLWLMLDAAWHLVREHLWGGKYA